MKYLLVLYGITSLISCSTVKTEEVLKKEIVAVEKAFEKKCKDHGIAAGFYEFADEKAIIKLANDSLIKGRANIRNHFNNPRFQRATVIWDAELVEVSKDGTLAYTYGRYLWIAQDSLGNQKEFKGVFHTVWKRQNDGKWKYVWD